MATRQLALLVLVGTATLVAPTPTRAVDDPPPETAGCDFDGDGFADLAIGVEEADVGTVENAGAAHVLYGDASGLSADREQLWHRDREGVNGSSRRYDEFGSSLACGDFDGDGSSDLAIGVANDEVHGVYRAGSVQILYGTEKGLGTDGNQIWHRDRGGINGATAESAHFGASLAAGDFDGNGYDDLAVGVPFDDIDGERNAGSVHIIYGTSEGLARFDDQIWHRDRGGINATADADERFGDSLAAGDFDDDGNDDLAIGVSADIVNDELYAGSVHIVYGTSDGLARFDDQIWHRARGFIDGTPRKHDRFGGSLATGDFDHDGDDDLAVGVPGDDVDGTAGAGSVQIIHGGTDGLAAEGDQIWHRGGDGILGRSSSQGFGTSVTASDLDLDRYDDLVVGVPEDSINDNPTLGHFAGSIHTLYGTVAGLSPVGNKIVDLDTEGVEGTPFSGDRFGTSLTSGDFNGDGPADVAIGVPYKDSGVSYDGGAVSILYADTTGLTPTGSQLWSRESPGISGTAQDYDHFAWSLA